MKHFFTVILLILGTSVLKAQHSGNIVYGDNSSTKLHFSTQRSLTDSTFVIQANILVNVIADSYVVTFGVSDSSATIRESNEKIERRIHGFISSLSKFDIGPKDIYVDMTTQNKYFDYHIKGNVAEQYLKGFEIKKNVIVKFNNINDLDEIMIAASGFQIYDLVKVDYIVNDLNKINTQLFKLGMEVINQKKEMYTEATNSKLLPASQVYSEDLSTYYPMQLYKTYTAESSSKVYSEYDRFIKKDMRNTSTVYYDKINYSGFDKVVNPSVVEPAVEFVMSLQIKFQIEKPRK
jgi:uncharacterized protein YggE